MPKIGVIDVIIPIYKGLEETQRCIESVLRSDNETPYELILVNDCSPETELVSYLRTIASERKLTLVEQAENLGFTRTVNGAIQLHSERDVILLNSDTEVANNWLDKIAAAAYSRDRVATVTPFSNNAFICSYPEPLRSNDLPDGWTAAAIDRLMDEINRCKTAELVTGIGFCMYIRRDCLNQIGLFDAITFPGYGEDVDFSQRAARAGWVNLLAADTFVFHVGAVSFGEERKRRLDRVKLIRSRVHPNYDTDLASFTMTDPIGPLRSAVEQARLARTR
jgi:GT2 family glycosyltransferase